VQRFNFLTQQSKVWHLKKVTQESPATVRRLEQIAKSLISPERTLTAVTPERASSTGRPRLFHDDSWQGALKGLTMAAFRG
jgi:hypothetical protein